MSTISDSEMSDVARNVIKAEIGALQSTLSAIDSNFIETCRQFISCKGKILVTGSGTSGNAAQRVAHLLSVGGTPAFFLSPSDGLHGGLGVLRKDDLVLALSKGGSSAELNDFCARARQLCGGLVVVTSTKVSPLTEQADWVVVLPLADDADLGNVVATGSSLAAGAICDAIVEVARVARGYSWKELLFTHPAGAVGRDAEKSLSRLVGED